MEEGRFDGAINGFQGVFPTASPVLKPSSDHKAEILEPAVKGALNVLPSCEKNPSLRRVVLTSSSSTLRVRDDFDPKIPLDESSWCSVELCEKLQEKKGYFSGMEGWDMFHIDDVALCHILVYEHQNSRGRYLCSSTVLDNNELTSLLSSRYPSLPFPQRFEELNRPCYEFNTSKFTGLGFKFKSIEDMFDDCIARFVEQGYLSSVI